MNVTLAGIGIVILAVIAAVWALARRERLAGRDDAVSDAQKDTLDDQARIKAARDAMADPHSDRRDRVRDQFTRR